MFLPGGAREGLALLSLGGRPFLEGRPAFVRGGGLPGEPGEFSLLAAMAAGSASRLADEFRQTPNRVPWILVGEPVFFAESPWQSMGRIADGASLVSIPAIRSWKQKTYDHAALLRKRPAPTALEGRDPGARTDIQESEWKTERLNGNLVVGWARNLVSGNQDTGWVVAKDVPGFSLRWIRRLD